MVTRCASATKIVRPRESTAETQPQLQPALLRLSAIISHSSHWCGSPLWAALILLLGPLAGLANGRRFPFPLAKVTTLLLFLCGAWRGSLRTCRKHGERESKGNHMKSTRSSVITIALIVLSLSLSPTFGKGKGKGKGSNNFSSANLVSDLPGVAEFVDPNLVNPWGVAL